uniref:ATP synthase F0 subunit 6 n=1 Tax=Stigmaeopsis continentalis TaxID=2547534 RepID=UPI00286A4DFA|nr:ATP synthase F0 subunit 6 [Stigmaeopsis continentalis]WKW93600.1 ATP synthase F0 subunit 6 [Stigmaeopsis continentalis]
MLNNLFSSFDMKNFMMSSFLILNMYNILLINSNKRLNKMMMMIKKFNLFMNKNITNMMMYKSIFLMIFMLNFLSLNVYAFNLTSQLNMNMTMIIILWFPILMMNITKMNNSFLVHLLPMGTSNPLIPMMILIELLSFFIRPLTLFLRLSINMIAGHVLVNLISKMILTMSNMYMSIMYIYMMMKFLVSFIQAYIIVTLLNLYMEEI